MKKQDYDKTIAAIETLCNITVDVEKAMSEESAGGKKITFGEGTGLVLKYSVPAVKTIANIKELGKELADTDSEEAEKAAGIILAHFGGSEEANEAIQKIVGGSAQVYEGVKKLIEIRK